MVPKFVGGWLGAVGWNHLKVPRERTKRIQFTWRGIWKGSGGGGGYQNVFKILGREHQNVFKFPWREHENVFKFLGEGKLNREREFENVFKFLWGEPGGNLKQGELEIVTPGYFDFPPVVHDWANKILWMSSRVSVTAWAYKRSHATYRKEKGIVSRWWVSS